MKVPSLPIIRNPNGQPMGIFDWLINQGVTESISVTFANLYTYRVTPLSSAGMALRRGSKRFFIEICEPCEVTAGAKPGSRNSRQVQVFN